MKMSQKSATTTTSFIISSNESLNRPSLSLSQSTTSDDNMTASETISNDNSQCYASFNPTIEYGGNGGLMHSYQTQRERVAPPLPTQPPPYISQGQSNGASIKICSSTIKQHHRQSQPNGANNHIESSDSAQMIYGIYNDQNNSQIQRLSLDQQSINSNSKSTQDSSLVAESRFVTNINSLDDYHRQANHGRNGNGNARDQIGTTYSSHYNQLNYSPKSKSNDKTFKNNHVAETTSVNPDLNLENSALMPINVKGMLLHGVSSDEIIKNWLVGIKCEEYFSNFIDNGYDMHLLIRMTPQDLAAIGCKSPTLRKKLLVEIKKLNLEDDIPNNRPPSLEQWLESLKLKEYYVRLCDEGYNSIDKICELTWEDLEEIGITKLGHQKRLLLGIERVKKFDKKQEECHNDHSIYDVHPNHRVSLNQNKMESRLGTLGRSTGRSGFFQTRSGASLDHRGLPVATVIPALKHVANSLANLDISYQVISTADEIKSASGSDRSSTCDQNNQSICLAGKNVDTISRSSDHKGTIKRTPPPLPPTRTNSLRIPQPVPSQLNNNSIYGNNLSIGGVVNGCNYNPLPTGSNSFLRTPKLGNPTDAKNMMLSQGGHVQFLSGQQTIRSIVPIREAPLPPIPVSQQMIHEKIDEEPNVSVLNFPDQIIVDKNSPLISSSLIGHQLASADEFPPPPPPQ